MLFSKFTTVVSTFSSKQDSTRSCMLYDSVRFIGATSGERGAVHSVAQTQSQAVPYSVCCAYVVTA